MLTTIDLGRTNCYLIEAGDGRILVDTGFPFQRRQLEEALEREGCRSGDLTCIVLTHGDIDHTGNAAYLRERYEVPIAMHEGDVAMCMRDGVSRERGAMPAGISKPLMILWLMRGISTYLVRQRLLGRPFERFEPDVLLKDGDDLAEYGIEAAILHTPGHSKGSISVLTGDRELVCGDAFIDVWGRIVDSCDAEVSQKVHRAGVERVYPGHGRPFSMERTNSSGS